MPVPVPSAELFVAGCLPLTSQQALSSAPPVRAGVPSRAGALPPVRRNKLQPALPCLLPAPPSGQQRLRQVRSFLPAATLCGLAHTPEPGLLCLLLLQARPGRLPAQSQAAPAPPSAAWRAASPSAAAARPARPAPLLRAAALPVLRARPAASAEPAALQPRPAQWGLSLRQAARLARPARPGALLRRAARRARPARLAARPAGAVHARHAPSARARRPGSLAGHALPVRVRSPGDRVPRARSS